MSISNLWKGQSPTIIGYSGLNADTALRIYEGYNNGLTTDYIEIAAAFMDSDDLIRTPGQNDLQLHASALTKRLDDWRADQNYSFESSYSYKDIFQGPVYSNTWQASSNNWVQNTSLQLVGFSIGTLETISFLPKSDFRNFFMEIQFKMDVDSGFASLALSTGRDSWIRNNYIGIVGAAGSNSFYVQYGYEDGSPGGVVDQVTGVTISAGISPYDQYYMRLVAFGDFLYSFYSQNNINYTWFSTFYLPDWGSNQFQYYFPAMLSSNSTVRYQNFQIFTYDRVNTINDLTKNIGFKSGLDEVYIPNLYESNFTSLSGFTNFGGTFVSGMSEIIGLGLSNIRQWSVLRTGLSFVDFNYEVEMKLNNGTLAGMMFGGETTWTGFYFTGLSNNAGDSIIMASGRKEVFNNGGTRISRDIPAYIVDYPFVNTWNKFNIIKNNDNIYYLINDQVFYAEAGLTGNYNIDTPNSVGFMVYGNAGSTTSSGRTASFRNLKVRPLSQVVDDFRISANSSGTNSIERLSDMAGFKYFASGLTLRIIPSLDPNEIPVQTFNTGLSYGWDVHFGRNTDGILNRSIVIGQQSRAEEWMNQGYPAFERSSIENENSINSYPDAKYLADKILINANKNFLPKTSLSNKQGPIFSMEGKAQPILEKYDVIQIIDANDDISGNYRIYNTNKNYNPSSGDFTQTFTLGLP